VVERPTLVLTEVLEPIVVVLQGQLLVQQELVVLLLEQVLPSAPSLLGHLPP